MTTIPRRRIWIGLAVIGWLSVLAPSVPAVAEARQRSRSSVNAGRRAEATRPGGVWVGQDGHDYVGPNSALAGSDVQDLHIRLVGLPPNLDVEYGSIRGLGGDEWQYNGSHGPWKAHMIRPPGATTADLFLEPTRVETGRPFTIHLRFNNKQTVEFDVAGGRADPNLRMAGKGLKARWMGQVGQDRAGPGPSVGPDGIQDVQIALENLSPKIEVQAVGIQAPGGGLWQFGVNPKAHPNAELIRRGDDPSKADLFFNPDRDRSGQTLALTVAYANGKTDHVTVKAGRADPNLRVNRPALPKVVSNRITVRWLGQDGRDPSNPGAVHLLLSGLPTPSVVAAALSDPVGGAWVYKERDDIAFDVAPYPLPLTPRRGQSPGQADLFFPPIRDESGATLTLRLLLRDGSMAVARFPGGPADPGKRAPGPASSSTVAHPGDDLNALANRFGTVRLAPGQYRLNHPLILNRPVTIVGTGPGTTLVFSQAPSEPPWTAAIKIHSGHTTLEGFAVRFAGPVRWAPDIDYGPAVIGSTDNHDQGHHDLKVDLVLRKLDLESPPPAGKWEEAARLIRLTSATCGQIENNVLRGGITELIGGPWRLVGNDYRGTHPGTYSFSVFSVHHTHDLVVSGNTARPVGPSGKTWRFLVLTAGGVNDTIQNNNVTGIGPRDDDKVQENAPEIILTESYRLRFEGSPLVVSPDGQILVIPPPQGDPAEPGDVVAILSGPQAGQYRRIAQRINTTTYLMDDALPQGEYPISIGNGFVNEVFEGNTIDARGGSVAAGMVLVGHHYGTKVLKNHVLGCGEAFRFTASPTEHPGPWGWSHAPFFGGLIEENTLEDALRGGTLAVEHGPPVKSSRGRVYMSATLKNNVTRWTPEFLRHRPNGEGPPPAFTIGDPRSGDPGELVLNESGNRVEGARGGSILVHAASVNGQTMREKRISLSADRPRRAEARPLHDEPGRRILGRPRSSLPTAWHSTGIPPMRLLRALTLAALVAGPLASAALADDEPFFSSEPIFPAEKKHNHASCIVELPNGDLLVAWYRGTGERTADDVEVLGSRLRKGQSAWEPRFLLADTPGYPDCNPALFAAPDKTLWLFWPTIIDHRWEGALLKYKMARDPGSAGAPEWTREGVLHVTPEGFDKAMAEALPSIRNVRPTIQATQVAEIETRAKDLLYQRLGWMPRVHPTVLPSGRWLLPLYTDTFSASIVAISDDNGATWSFSSPMIGFGNIQPSLVRRNDGTIVAFMRENGPKRRIRLSTSTDEGKTWSPVTESELPNPGAGIEAIRLSNGHWAIVYNDTTSGRHSLAVSISDDEGKTWTRTRHIEKKQPGEGSFHYPSIMQAADGSIHVSYTHGTRDGSTIQHARFNEAWVQQGDPKED